MTTKVSDLIMQLKPDPWRTENGFSKHIADATDAILKSDSLATHSILNEWMQRYQPCLFGRLAAKLNLLSYCILTESDLQDADEKIRDKIQEARTRWTREAFEGRKSGFVILAASSQITNALPNNEVKELAQLLCSLYLLTDIDLDHIYLDEIFLEKPGQLKTTWKWHAGVNYFCAQGDKRWWQDHSIPAGMAFSVNSVGHMVKAGMMAKSMQELEALLGAPKEDWITSKVDSLEKALAFAMRTIWNASDTVSGKATELLALPADLSELPVKKCPIELPSDLSDKNFCHYNGFYHTDHTLPSQYFLSFIERPKDISPYTLDFTYLFDKGFDNPDFLTMGEGRQIRANQETENPLEDIDMAMKKLKGYEETALIENNPRLIEALSLDLE